MKLLPFRTSVISCRLGACPIFCSLLRPWQLSGVELFVIVVRLGDLVRIDWVSTEDGSHILTVGIGSSVYMFTQVSQGVAQRNIVMMKEHETHRRAPLRKASSLANPERISTRLVSVSLLPSPVLFRANP